MLPDPTDIAQEQAARFLEDKLREQLEAAAKQSKRVPRTLGSATTVETPPRLPAICSVLAPARKLTRFAGV
jgi:hypothetical protein